MVVDVSGAIGSTTRATACYSPLLTARASFGCESGTVMVPSRVMDVSVKGIEAEVVARLAEQAEREGVSAQEWMRQALRRTAGLLTPRELADRVGARVPASEERYQAAMETVKTRRSARASTVAGATKPDVRHRGR